MKENEPNPETTPVEAKSAQVKPESVATAPKADTTPAEPNPEAKAESKPAAAVKKPTDLTPQLVQRVHELYAQLGREEIRAVLAWEKAEGGIRENETKAEPKPVAEETEAKPKAIESKPKVETAEAKPEVKAIEPKPDAKTAATMPEVKSAKPKPEPAAKVESKGDLPAPESKPAKPKTEFRNKIIFTLSILGVLAALVAAYFFGLERKAQPPVFKPVSNPYDSAIYANGMIESEQPNGANINIFPEVSGPITQVLVQEGQQVSAGTPLFTIDDSVQRANTELAEANLKVTRDQYDKRRASYDIDPKSISKDVLDTAEDAVIQAAAALKAANALLQYYSVKAPVDGVVLALNAAVGGYASSQGAYDTYTELFDPLVVMSGPQDYMDVRCYIDEILVSRLPSKWHIQAQMQITGTDIKVPLEFVRVQPYVSPKIELSNEKQEQVDLRVLPVIFRFEKKDFPVYPGQLVDVFIGQK
jgi:HlyD family secretion protein